MPKVSHDVEPLARLLALIKPVPTEWLAGKKAKARSETLEPLECRSWKVLMDAWKAAMHWTGDMDAALSVMMAVVISTEQQGDQQLFLQLIGAAGSAKTRLCDAMLVSKHCHALEHLTGFHSGFNDGTGEDFSLLGRINRKTLITPEGDVLMSNPKCLEIMSQQRRIFDGTSGATYKNKKQDTKHEGLRTPWIIAGTFALLNHNQAALGDRFFRVVIDPPGLDVKREILRKVGLASLRTVTQRSNCSPSSIIEDKLLTAYRLTGGYVDYLRERAGELLTGVGVDEDAVVGRCATLAEFTADCRARPDANAIRMKIGERHDTKELPTRLTFQFCRLARCLAAAMGRREVDDEVLKRVKKVALDTSRGHVLSLVKNLWAKWTTEERGNGVDGLAVWIGEGPDKVEGLLKFMRKMDVVYHKESGGVRRWHLTERMRELCAEVL